MKFEHVPVLLGEVIDALDLKIGDVVVDATLGGGGHSQEILKRIGNKGVLVGIDQDLQAIKAATKRLSQEAGNFHAVHSSFTQIDKVLCDLGISGVDAILADLGVSSHQIDEGSRGFSYMNDGPLDMRMNPSQKFTAADLVNNSKESFLRMIIKEYGEERFSGRIASAIVEARPHTTTLGLAKAIEASVPAAYYRTGGHPAKRTFQALRIEVNRELESLELFLKKSVDALKPRGRLAVISFHSLEDRIVKQSFKTMSSSCLCPPKSPQCICGHRATLEIVTRKPIVAGAEEVKLNSRSLSAKLRVATKLGGEV